MPLVLRIALYLLVADGVFALYLAEFLGARGVAPGGGAPGGGLAPPAPVRRGRASGGRPAPRAPRGAGLGGGHRLPHRERPRRPGEAPPLPGPLQARDAPDRPGFAHGRVPRVLHARRGVGVGVRRGIPLRVRRLRRAAQLDRAPPAPGEREPHGPARRRAARRCRTPLRAGARGRRGRVGVPRGGRDSSSCSRGSGWRPCRSARASAR